MVIEHILGATSEEKYRGAKLDFVEIDWYDCQKKIHRKISRSGRDIAIRLDEETQHRGLQQGDVLLADGETAVVVDIPAVKAIVAKAESPQQIAKICYEIGNRHAPLYYVNYTENYFAIPYDTPFELLFTKLGIAYEVKKINLDIRQRISGTADHAHTHDHGEMHNHGA